MPVLRRWERKSVSQLVQQYQSCTDLRDIGKYHKKEDLVDGRCHEGDVRVSLSRCLSMDVLPQRPASSTRALCALFESKLQYSNKPLDGGLQDRKNNSNNPNVQKDLNLFERTAMKECSNRGTRVLKEPRKSVASDEIEALKTQCIHNKIISTDDKNSGILIKGSSIQSRYHILTSSSVRDRSALYLSSAADAPGEQPESSGVTHERKTKVTKMDVTEGRITVSHTVCDDDELPPPPPVPPRPLDYEESSTGSPLPPPPPKESFSTYYQQRNKSELKRLFKHIHPDLRAGLDDVAEEELLRAVQMENPQAAEDLYQGEVQSMRWIFENWTLDNIGEPRGTKKLLDVEDLTGGDVRGTTSKFEHADLNQPTTQRQVSRYQQVKTNPK
uniref:Uncharacterized protein n=1 Tax=Knipowitschia caucasica TaxID=637954 RepID=A0AAV2JXR9_KNICA